MKSLKPKRMYKRLLQGVTVILVSLSLNACNNGTSTTSTENGTKSTPTYTWNQTVFCLNILSNVSAMYNHKTGIQALTINAIDSVLADTGVQNLIGTWNRVWGPVVYVDPDSGTTINTMYIAQQKGTNNYVVAIAGTDPSSKLDWGFEDFDAIITWGWPYCANPKDSSSVRIGLPSLTGLGVLMTMVDSSLSLGAREYLGTQTQNNGSINVWVTGHSLGGALSPTYALFLNDTKAKWVNSGGSANINVLAVAGASPGNVNFSSYYNNELGPNTYRVWNTMDLVPHGFQPDMLSQSFNLYNSNKKVGPFPPTITVTIKGKTVTMNSQLALDAAVLDAKTWNFYQLYPADTVNFTSSIYMPAADTISFGDEALYQHVPAYGVFFGIGNFQSAMSRVLNFSIPFFSAGDINTVSISNYDTANKNFNSVTPN